jgi:pSer/pThr/pTyr-binding forkhead associated (FHA) protein
MFALRVLNGPQAGHVHILKQGKTRLGRSPTCDFHVKSNGVSKEHLEISIMANQITVTDLKSSNGTYVNGVRTQTAFLKLGDKIGIDKVLFDVVLTSSLGAKVKSRHENGALVPYQGGNELALVQNHQMTNPHHPSPHQPHGGIESSGSGHQGASDATGLMGMVESVKAYIDQVFLPGIFHLVEVFEFRTVVIGFSFFFIVTVTLLSVIPMNQISSESIKNESKRRAQTVARALANSNEKVIRSGEMTGYSADLVLKDEGISHVYILGKDGSIIAPPEMAGLVAKDLTEFVLAVRGQTKEVTAEVTGGKIAASCPILIFDPELQQNVAKAHAVVVYDPGNLKFDEGRMIALFLDVLVIGLIVGGLLFYLLYRLIEYPFTRLNEELDTALRENKDHTEIELKFPIFQQLLVSINSLLTRIQQGGGGSVQSAAQTRDQEWINMLELFGYPAMLLSKDMNILGINAPFESLTGVRAFALQGQTLQFLPDQAMQKNIEELMTQAHSNTQTVHKDRLDISGHAFNLQCQALTVAGEARYFLVTISPDEQVEGGAA